MRTVPRNLVIAALYVVVGLCITTTTVRAADPFDGTWKLNLAKSKFSPGPPPKNLTITYAATGDGIKATTEGVNFEGNPVATTYTATYDVKDTPVTGTGAPYDTIALKRIDPNTVESTTKKDGKVVSKGKRVVSKDGKVMTLTSKGTNAKGEPTNNVAVYDKQ
jgi:hypothetical protein